MTLDSAREYVFPTGEDVSEARMLLIASGAKEELCPLPWVENHYALIAWKLACMERTDPKNCGHVCLTPQRLVGQLRYRFAHY